MQSELVEDHEMFGWYVYAAVMIPCFFILSKLEAKHLGSTLPAAPNKALTSQETQEPGKSERAYSTSDRQHGNQIHPKALVIAIVVTALSPIGMALLQAQTAPITTDTPTINLNISEGWHTVENEKPIYETGFQGFTSQTTLQIVNPLSKIRLSASILAYGKEEQGAELVNDNNLLALKPWREIRTEKLKGITDAKLSTLTHPNGTKIISLWYYRVGELRTASAVKAKLASLTTLFDASASKALVSISSQCATDCQNERELIISLFDHGAPY